mmetsp:Transcript_1596/g.4179  ORF Transcript_1596/g.4179 Transcript_1596/m.4179 type:complete len:288 (-) Transcript_1596:222-1085(-)
MERTVRCRTFSMARDGHAWPCSRYAPLPSWPVSRHSAMSSTLAAFAGKEALRRRWASGSSSPADGRQPRQKGPAPGPRRAAWIPLALGRQTGLHFAGQLRPPGRGAGPLDGVADELAGQRAPGAHAPEHREGELPAGAPLQGMHHRDVGSARQALRVGRPGAPVQELRGHLRLLGHCHRDDGVTVCLWARFHAALLHRLEQPEDLPPRLVLAARPDRALVHALREADAAPPRLLQEVERPLPLEAGPAGADGGEEDLLVQGQPAVLRLLKQRQGPLPRHKVPTPADD